MYKKGGISPQVIGRMKRDLSSTCEELSCSFDIIYSDSNISISRISYYDNYPIHHFVKNDVNVIVEGYLFQHLDGNPMQRLREMAEPAEVTISGLAKEIGDFVDRTDGEFVVTLYNQRTGDMAVFNDILGRLPTYFFSGPDSFILSREVKFIAAMMPEPVLSAHAAAQSLVFHFPLGDRTLLRDVK